MNIINLPNFISIARLLSVPVIVWLLIEDYIVFAFWLFVCAGVSDAVDGFIAKAMNARTELGTYLDPLADKMLLVSVYLTLGWRGMIVDWLVILVVFRDVLILGGALLSYTVIERAVTILPLWISKINTSAQIALISIVLGREAFAVGNPLLAGGIEYLSYAVALTTVVSGMAYLVRWVQGISGGEDS